MTTLYNVNPTASAEPEGDSVQRTYRPSLTEAERRAVLQALADRVKFYERMLKLGRLKPGTKAHDTYLVSRRLMESWTNMQRGQWSKRKVW
jgi:hypothetical protein